jgi:hypothetical protein
MKITIASDVDKDRLQAELSCGDDDWGYMYEDGGSLVLEIYPRLDGRPWLFALDELLSALMRARLDLTDGYAEPT